MAKITINERLAQLISEKNMGVKVSSVNDISKTVSTSSAPEVKKVKTDSVEIKGSSEDGKTTTVSPDSYEVNTKAVVTEENPFIHNQVVDDIAKKLLKAFSG